MWVFWGVVGRGERTLIIQPTSASHRLGECICSPYNLQRFSVQNIKKDLSNQMRKKENPISRLGRGYE